ncbi:MAG: N-6 DNA methylase [Nitrosopumilus sp.]|nr:N-6 DNA methylase [Nitrosopumilus sp.]
MSKVKINLQLQNLKEFLLDQNSEVSKDYITKLLSGKLKRPEETFVHTILNDAFWEERGYSINERNFEAPAGGNGRVEGSLEFYGKKIAIECKKPYEVRKDKEEINELDGNDIHELKDQIGEYLITHDFIIFTNGFHWYFYSKESYRIWLINKDSKKIDLKPYFKHLTHKEIFDEQSPDYIENFLNKDNILESLSSFENKTIRHILSDKFFLDLKNWVEFVDFVLRDVPADTKARTTTLINKLIFVRTMEGVGVIPNGFLSTLWDNKKGIRKSTVSFIDQIDDELSEIYDTELFTSKFIEDKDGKPVLDSTGSPEYNSKRKKNFAYNGIPEEFFDGLLKQSEELNLKNTGITKIIWKDRSFYIRSLYWWKFESISADILGKAYETYFAIERKKLGIFYTPILMTEYLTKKTISNVFDSKINLLKDEFTREEWNISKIQSIGEEIKDLKICDPSCGSGSFLIQAMRVVWYKYKEIEEILKKYEKSLEEGKSNLDKFSSEKFGILRYLEILFRIKDNQERIGSMILRHIYGNDKDVKAVDTAKLNIWLECLRLDPNSFRREVVKNKRHVLPNLELNITVGDSLIGLDIESVDNVVSTMRDTIKQIHKLKNEYTESFDKTAIANTAVELRTALKGFADHEFINLIGITKTEYLLAMLTPAHWAIQHSDVFFDDDGNLKPQDKRGFDVIVGNPPWEVLKPTIDEYFGSVYEKTHDDRFRMLTKDKKNSFVEEGLKNIIISGNWEYYKKVIKTQMEYFQKTTSFSYQGGESKGKKLGGDINLYKLFVEQYYKLLKKDGLCGVVLPANFYSDLAAKGLRELIFNNCKIISLYGFDNQKGIFEEIHRQFKFIMLVFEKGGKTRHFKATFYLRDIEKIPFLDEESVTYDLELVKTTSPIAMSLIECKNTTEVNIIKKLYEHPLLLDKKWDLTFTNEFHMTKHAPLFNREQKGEILFEAKMMHQFTHLLAEPRYWVEEENAKKDLNSRENKRVKQFIKKLNEKLEPESPEIQLDYNNYRLAWRNISRSTDQRTMICTILPPNVFLGNSLNYIRPLFFNGKQYVKSLNEKDLCYLCGMLNSFVLDFVLRFRVSINANMFYVYEMPVPRISEKESNFQKIVERVGSLICITKEYELLKQKLEIKKIYTNENERMNAIAEINAYAAKIYNINEDELKYILSTFPIVKNELKELILKKFQTVDSIQ